MTAGDRKASIRGALCAFCVSAVTFLATMSHTYGFIDRGELAAVAATLGIAHPTGYPTLTIFGHLAVRLVPASPVLVLNTLSALWCALAVAVLSLLVHRVLREGFPEVGPGIAAALSAFSALLVGFGTTWWSQASGFEVYSLHALLTTVSLLAFQRWVEGVGRRSNLVFSFALGLSFTNHLSTVMLVPSLLWKSLSKARLKRNALREAGLLVPAFLLGLLPYLYLPLRASMQPRLNWGAPDNLERFFEHVTGAQFHFAVGLDSRVVRLQTSYFLNTLWSDLSFAGIGVAALGLLALARRRPSHALSTSILFLTCTLVAMLYDINDIGNYYLPAMIALAVWIGSGLAFLAMRWRRGAIAAGALLVLGNAVRHYGAMNERENNLAEDLVWNVLHDLPAGAVVFSNHWDYWVSGSLYAQEVDGFRRDVVVLDPEGLRSEPYLLGLERHYPELMTPVRQEVGAFKEWIRAFRRQPNLSAAQAEAYYSAYYGMIAALVERHPDREFFVTEWTDPKLAEGYSRIPMKLAYRLTKEPGYRAQDLPEYRFRPWRNRVDPYAIKVSEIYTTSLLSRARYEEEHGRPDEARRYGLYALSFDPRFTEDDVPDFPLHIEDQIVEVLRNYARLRERVRKTQNQGGRP